MFVPLHDKNSLEHIKLQWVTLLLIAANVFVWWQTATPAMLASEASNAFFYSYGFIPSVANDTAQLPAEFVVIPQPVSYVSYAFLHGDFLHLAGNMLFLWVFGDNVEDATGHIRFFVFYILCAIAGAWVHQLALPSSNAPLIGASGATAGIVAAYLLLHPKVKVWILFLARIPLRLSAMWVIGGWILFQIYNFLAVPESQVSWAAHVGGIVAGLILLPILMRHDVRLFDQNLQEVTEDADSPATNNVSATDTKPDNSSIWGRGRDNK